MSTRQIKKSYRSCVGYFKSYKNSQQLAFESILERDFFMLLEFDETVISYEEQPFQIKYQLKETMTRYTPDVLVTYRDGTQKVFEVKYQNDINSDPALQHKLSVLKDAIQDQKKVCFEVFTDEKVDQAYLKNCVFLYKNAFIFHNDEITTLVVDTLNQQTQPISIQELIEMMTPLPMEQLRILPYLWHEIFKNPSLIDMKLSLKKSSLLYVGEGCDG